MTDAPAPTAEKLAAKRRDQVGGALKRYRFMANFTGYFLLILCAEMIYKYLLAPAFDLGEWLRRRSRPRRRRTCPSPRCA
ncbi:hypothetical protein TSOC111612_11780 [Tsukamurella ocularis]|uniref:hypothetical protein n=1 Tax=Tsukamurella ocularis TaxID=1970234 RepID=UPI0039EEF5FF